MYSSLIFYLFFHSLMGYVGTPSPRHMLPKLVMGGFSSDLDKISQFESCHLCACAKRIIRSLMVEICTVCTLGGHCGMMEFLQPDHNKNMIQFNSKRTKIQCLVKKRKEEKKARSWECVFQSLLLTSCAICLTAVRRLELLVLDGTSKMWPNFTPTPSLY